MTNNPHLLDLGLIRAFVAIYETKSVTAAAERLFLTQPTLSYSLARLRDILNDRLFVRDGRYMKATRRADECYLKFEEILQRIDEVISESQEFDPLTSTRRFKIAMSDIATLAFLPPLMEVLSRKAPDVEVEVVQPRIQDIPDELAIGRIDAAIGNLSSLNRLTASSLVMKEHFVCLVSANHTASKGTLTERELIAARYVNVSSDFTGYKHLEQAFRDAGIHRRISVQVKQFTVLPNLLRNTDYIAVLPSVVGRMFLTHGGLKTLPLPIHIPPIEVRLHWNVEQGKNAPQKWFYQVINEALLDAYGA